MPWAIEKQVARSIFDGLADLNIGLQALAFGSEQSRRGLILPVALWGIVGLGTLFK